MNQIFTHNAPYKHPQACARLSLKDLIAPLDLNEFRNKYWEKNYLVISRCNPEFYNSIFTLSDVDRCIYSRRTDPNLALTFVPPPQSGNTARRYRVSELSMDGLYNAFNSGATIRLEDVQESWPSIAVLVSTLEEMLDAKLSVNLYMTPPNSQGFKLHYDLHDSFILQVSGTKKWSIYAPDVELPIELQSFTGLKEVSSPEASSPRLLQEVRLEAGDLLYLPRGFPHKATAVDTLSLHLTVGIRPVYWLEFLKTAIDLASREEPILRRSLEPGSLSDLSVAEHMRQTFESALRALDRLSFEETLAAIAKERLTHRGYPPDGHFAQLADAAHVRVDDIIIRRPGLLCSVKHDSTTASLYFSTNSIRGPLHILPALEFIRDNRQFTVGDIPNLSDSSRLVLVRRAIREGLLSRLSSRIGDR